MTKEDVLRAVEQPRSRSPARGRRASRWGDRGAVDADAAAIARHMTTSVRTAPHCTTIVEADVTELETERRTRGLTALPIIARHVLDTLVEFPALNAWMRDDTVVLHEPVHLGVAVSLGDDGLVVPVIHDAHELIGRTARRADEAARHACAGGRAVTRGPQRGDFHAVEPRRLRTR